MKYFGILIASFLFFLACTKEELINLSKICDKGDMWMVNSVDTFTGIDSLDSFKFVQGAGFHLYNWTRSPFNSLQVSVYQLPDTNKTIVYKKAFLRDLKCVYRGSEYSFDNKTDSIVAIANNKTHFILLVNKVKLKNILGGPDIELRACNIKMNDINP